MPSILVADDDDDIRELVAGMLESAGHDVVAVPDGLAAYEEIRRGLYEVVVIDNQMPGLTGLEVLEAVGRHDDLRRPIMLMMSALATREDVRRGYRAGADEFIAKPFTRVELVERVHALLDERALFEVTPTFDA